MNRYFGFLLLLAGPLFAQQAPVDNTRAYLEVLRSDFNADKVTLYNRVLQLSEPEAKKFWPIYRDYERELVALSDQRLELIRDFFTRQEAGKLTNEASADIADRWLKTVQTRLDLWKKYHRKISKAVSPTRAAQFLQLENQIALFIDIAIASEMPAITPACTK
ncbi:MAG TPA: hypothetical protein VLZ12_13925 [Verrucomicrobiae bacterium]|nr:hypothetical protein [Verrucomicrobiae bacterium]